MKQVIQEMRSGKTQVTEVPKPAVSAGALLVRTTSSVLSPGTERAVAEFASKSLLGKARARPDLVGQVIGKARRDGLLAAFDAVRNRLDQPLPLGYSSAGVIVECGHGVANFKPGQRVACAGGGFAVHAEFAVVPHNLAAPVPDGVSDEQAAFATVGSVALHGFRLTQAAVGERVAVIGLGLLGQLALRIAAAAGCRAYGIDLEPWRVQQAQAAGFEACGRDQAETMAGKWTDEFGFDAVLICADSADSDPVELAGAIARDRATVVAVGAVGLELPRRIYYGKELTFRVSRAYGPGRYDPAYEEAGMDYPIGYVRWTEGRNLSAFLGLIADGAFDPSELITHRYSLEQADHGYQLLQSEAGRQSLAVVLEYEAADEPSESRLQIEPISVSEDGLSVGVIGAGLYARSTLLPALDRVREIRRVGLASGRGLSAADSARRHRFAYASGNWQELVEDPDINGLIVATRHHQHAEMVLAGLLAGKHVLCEKPLAIDGDGLAQIWQGLAQSSSLLTVGYNRRYAPMMQALKSHFADIGPLMMHYRVNAGQLPADHWLLDRAIGGGRLIGEGCHFVDAMAFVCGSRPTRVSAVAQTSTHDTVEDWIATFEFADGSHGSLLYNASGDRAAGKEQLEVHGGGRSGMLIDFHTLRLFANGRTSTRRAWLRSDKGHVGLLRAFAAAARRGGPEPIPYEHLFAVSAATFAAEESLRSGTPVAVEFPPAAA